MTQTMIKKLGKISKAAAIAVGAVIMVAGGGAYEGAQAAGKAKELKQTKWHFDGIFGTYDDGALQRGYQVYSEICANCHGVEQLSFRNLGQKGGPFHLEECPAGLAASIDCANPNENPYVKQLAADYKFQVTDGPDEDGDMFERAPVPSDRIPGPYRNNNQARAANNGALPPDLSLITKARHHGPDYVYSLMLGYKQAPDTVTIAPGQFYNEYYPGDMSLLIKDQFRDGEGDVLGTVDIPYGGAFAMAPPLVDGIIKYADESIPETVEQYAKDVSEFLMWAAEPKLEARKQLGMMSIIYLLILSGLLYWSYREIWSDQH